MIVSIIDFISSSCSFFILCTQTIQTPFIRDETLWERVLVNMELCLLGITVAVLILFEDEIETYIAPTLFEPSETIIKQPFSKASNFIKKFLVLDVVTVLERSEFDLSFGAVNDRFMRD